MIKSQCEQEPDTITSEAFSSVFSLRGAKNGKQEIYFCTINFNNKLKHGKATKKDLR